MGLLIGGLGSAVFAAIPDSEGVIHACYRTSGLLANGQVRIIDSDTGTCNGNETEITWSQSDSGGSDNFVENLAGADFSQADLRYRNFANHDLHDATFNSADLTDSNLSGTDLSGTHTLLR